MAIGELCTRNVVVMGRNESVAEAARLMRENHIGSIVVVERTDGHARPVGMITDRDIAVGVVAVGLDPEATPAEAAIGGKLVTVRQDEGIGRALALMRAEAVRRLPVVDAAGALVGVIAADDLIDLLADEMAQLAGMFDRGVRRERAERRISIGT